MTNHLTVTVGITTCYGKKQLVTSLISLKDGENLPPFSIKLIADAVPLSPSIKKELTKMGVTFTENKLPKSAFKKRRQLLIHTTTDLIILSQDDILYSKNVIAKIIEEFERDPDLTMLCVRNTPIPTKNFFQNAVNIGTELNNTIGRSWNKGDNYLAALGRVMAFRTLWLKKLPINFSVVSDDAYLYFLNKKHGGKYKCLWNTEIYFKNPDNMTEQLAKSSRFQSSQYEMESLKVFGDLTKEYRIPFIVIVQAAVIEFLKRPFPFLYYCLIFLYTRFFKHKPRFALNPLWKSEVSTKKL